MIPSTSAFGLPAPAKLNLFLHVVGRREDGKHLLQSIFTLIDLCDEIDLIVRNDGVVSRTGDLQSAPEDDLCFRAAALLKEAAIARAPEAGRLGADIRVLKRIPAGAGMGGGSSDAATTLIGLNRLWALGLSRTQLAQLGLRLGADVPFFIWGKTGFVEGIGERISPFEIPAARYLIIWPGRSVSTAQIFGSASLTRNAESRRIAVFSDFIRSRWPELPGRNDLQPAAEALEPEISKGLAVLKRMGLSPRMTGSGSAVFAVEQFESRILQNAENLPESWRCFSAGGISEHPLRAWVTE